MRVEATIGAGPPLEGALALCPGPSNADGHRCHQRGHTVGKERAWLRVAGKSDTGRGETRVKKVK